MTGNLGKIVLSVAAASDIGVVRSNNEDNFYLNGVWREDVGQERMSYQDVVKVVKQPKIFAVMDGMGGLKDGEIASLTAARELDRLCMEDPSYDMLTFLLKMNDSVCEARRESGGRLGSTAVMACVDTEGVRFANIGDSRGYLLRDGELTRMSVDHSERGSLERVRENLGIDEELPGNMRDGLTQYLGIEKEELIIEPEVGEKQPFDVGAMLLLCSDGLTSCVTEETIQELLTTDDEVQVVAKKLIDLAIESGSRDNITVILVRREE